MNSLRMLRKQNKLSQNEAASILGISRRTYQKYESIEGNNNKLDYLSYVLGQRTRIDEENGLLTIDEIQNTISEVLKKYNVKSCYLFGSYAKGKESPTSDVDLLIDSSITGLDYYGLVEELRVNLHKKVDLITLRSIQENATMLYEILKDGIKIYGQHKR